MNEGENTSQHKARSISTSLVGVIVGITAILAPVGIIFYSFPYGFSMASMLWVYSTGGMGYYGYFMFDPFSLIASLPYTFLRLVFIWMMMRLYSGKTTFRKAAIAGIAAELQLPVFYLIMYIPMFIMYPGFFSITILLPTPLLIFVAYLLTKFYPIPMEKLWIEKEQTKKWWEPTKDQQDMPHKIEEEVVQTEEDWLKE